MINRADLVRTARAHLRDALILYRRGSYDGAVYLCGYAVEIALKARICRTLKWAGFPSSPGEFANFRSLQTHNLDTLLRFTAAETRVKTPPTVSDWSVVGNWNPELRYSPVGTQSQAQAGEMINATRNLLKVLL